MPYQSWGNYPQVKHEVRSIYGRNELLDTSTKLTILPYGQGRSYGDCCLNDQGMIIETSHLDHFIQFDKANGILTCEAGVTLDTILKFIVPDGWFLPVNPGTKFISIGGAIANDIHGKNHHQAGTFGRFVRQFELLRSNGDRILCSPEKNVELFQATIGGLGLTGLITWSEIQLKPIACPFIDVETIQFKNYEEFFELSAISEKDFEYTVAWIDCLATSLSLGRGLFMRGNHHPTNIDHLKIPKIRHLSIPCFVPNFVLNHWTVKAFNTAYYLKQRKKITHTLVYYDSFFYPLDSILHWNKIYGKRGFFQYQCLVPYEPDLKAIQLLLEKISRSGTASFLAVLKTFGNIPSPGMMSFPKKGVTLALDFANQGLSTLQLFNELDEIVLTYNGSLYPAKDARMSPKIFQTSFPQWKDFAKYIDPKFSSSFWKRVSCEQ